MSRKLTTAIFILCLTCSAAFSQIGGSGVYSFLNIPASARVAALGGTLINVKDDDLNSALQNPAALNSTMSNYLLFSGVSHVAGIGFGDVAYGLPQIRKGKYGTFDAWMHYVSYGNFDETDVTGEVIGNFKAADYAFTLGWGYQLNPLFSVGANLKGIYSDYYVASATGAALDMSAMFADTASGWNITMLVRNAGSQLKKYEQDSEEQFPMEALIGISKKFSHVPIRLGLTYNHLEKFNTTYLDSSKASNYDALTGEFKPEKITFVDKFSHHFILPSVEILLSKNFNLRAAYNLQRRSEMKLDTRGGTIGLSYGFGLKISKFIISYGRASYSLAGASNHFSIAANLAEFTSKK